MAPKNKNKRKFKDLTNQSAPFYQSNSSKPSNDHNNNNNEDDDKKIEEYQPPLNVLYELYPNFPQEMIEDLYIDKQRNYFLTKETLNELSQCDMNNNNNIIENDTSKVEEQQQQEIEDKSNNLSSSQYEDINKYIQFNFDDHFSNDYFDINYYSPNESKKNHPAPNETIKNQNKKGNDDYHSVFFSSNCLVQQTPCEETDLVIDEFLLDEYITLIQEAFPQKSRMEITAMICECDFDIDKTILMLFNCDTSSKELESSEECNISNKEDIINNFSSFNKYQDNLIDVDSMTKHNLQKTIEKQIKKKSLKDNLSFGKDYEKEFPPICENNQSIIQGKEKIELNDNEEEYFLDKNINQIQSKTIREDLIKLCNKYPLEDQFTIKWIYYQYMDYLSTSEYLKLNSSSSANGSGLKGLVEKIDKDNKYNNNNPWQKITHKKSQYQHNDSKGKPFSGNEDNNDQMKSLLLRIINQNPKTWQVDNNSGNINLREYQSIRKQLLWQAQLAFSNKRYNDGKAIMAKAQRYKYEINKMLEKKKIETFLKNNQQLSIENLYRKKEQCIDLHGLSVDESKMILTKKLKDLYDKKERESLKSITFCIITGKGMHSIDGVPILLPVLSSWLRNQLKIKTKVDEERGMIRLML